MGKTADIIIRKQVRDELDKHGVELSDLNTMEDVLEYLDQMNEGLDETDFAELYTPQNWIEDTLENYPEFLKPKGEIKDKYCKEVLYYLIRQREECIDQTGIEPDINDYKECLDTSDFKDYMEKIAELSAVFITIDDIFNYLMEYWNTH